ncbi:hypothetical protein ASPACDRAFT_34758 [Aspergillus aculeatus ATCC 16872]|uniref:Uncharacterized protein n=1 Tax=Aspergillus aculeatus (strain ATCC 16872 / CBS 172.66 / WB 5094) TaxID=690307 RepID=A0A1L9WJL8_ASPA1|nr:uncharacterized protein ASPACDRAFT_34758 [Aspergillus aculeatus ATCC 16872]OJJ96351.1 hypothetical protein ASPACDRAFT_34758 [Aspergillus aculeatus ATCC 16872]
MTTLLEKAVFHILFVHKKKKIADFLRTTTRESLLSELHINLVREVVTSIPPESIFEASSIQDSTHEQPPYWSRKSFEDHLARTHPDTVIPDTAIDVLWSCFCFYAYHPFPILETDDRKVELPAFERGLLLLSRQGTWLLGTIQDGFGLCWARLNEPCTCGLRMNRIFRSISRFDRRQSRSDPPTDGFDTFVANDVTDAVLAIFPSHPKLHPSLEQVQPLAESLLGGRTGQYAMRAGDFTALLSLVMRLRVQQLTDDNRDGHHGFLDEPRADQEELARVLVRPFSHEQNEYLAPEMVLRALDILPNLEQSFHQLWATLFPLSPSTERPILETGSSAPDTMDAILRAVSLFTPPFQTHQRSELARRVQGITFHNCYDMNFQGSADSLDLRHILQHATTHNHPTGRAYLILFLGDHQVHDTDKVVVGAFFRDLTLATPTPTTAKENDDKAPPKKDKSTVVARPQLLFQLQPRFSLFRWTGGRSSMPLSVSPADNSPPGHAAPRNCIGDPDQSRVALEIDADTKQATFLRRGTVRTAGTLSGGYEELTRKRDGESGGGNSRERQTTFTVGRVAVFRVEGGPTYAYENPW